MTPASAPARATYRVRAQSVEACNCALGCNCYFGGTPNEGICEFIIGYDIQEGRPWWKVRLTAILLTVAVSIFILVSFALVLVGPTIATRLADTMNLGPAFEWTWKILQWPVLFALASLGIASIYYFAPDVQQQWVWLAPGAFFATTLWLAGELAGLAPGDRRAVREVGLDDLLEPTALTGAHAPDVPAWSHSARFALRLPPGRGTPGSALAAPER